MKGYYEHYKGNIYQVMTCAIHTETGEEMVVYRDASDSSKVWVRPRSMFEENVTAQDSTFPRFRRVGVIKGLTARVKNFF